MKKNNTKSNTTKKPVKKQAVKKQTATKAKTSKKSVEKSINKVKDSSTKKTVKKVNKQDTKKSVRKASSKVTKNTIKKVNKKEVKQTNKATKELTKKRETVYDPIDLDVLSSVFAEKESKEKKYKNLMIVCAVLFILLIVCIFVLFRNNNKNQSSNMDGNNKEVITESYIDSKYKDIWNEYHDNSYVSDDYVGQIIFESGIINEPVMQGETNDTYLNRNYKTFKYEVCGPVFMDFACKKNDQNLVLYGHTRSKAVDPNRIMMFTPLHLLEDENNYDANKTIYFVYEDSVDVYLVSKAYFLQTIEDKNGLQYLKDGEPLYYLNTYSNSEFDEYVETVEERQLYDTGVEITSEDKLLTLQTCLDGSTDKFIVIAKKIETRQYR